MAKKIDSRIPNDVGEGVFTNYSAIGTPWNKLISFHDAYWYMTRQGAVMGALFMEVARIVVPDYEERTGRMCELNGNVMLGMFKSGYGQVHADKNNNIFPFLHDQKTPASLWADAGDERLLMNGRVNYFGSHRVEKELDTCPWDILGSEICRISPAAQEGTAYGTFNRGDKIEYVMSEARGCGDPHCRFICESRDKYPVPGKEDGRDSLMDYYGPLGCTDQDKYTPEERFETEPQFFREECGYKYHSGLNKEFTATEMYLGGSTHCLGSNYAVELLNDAIAKGETTKELVYNIIDCVFRGAGKATYGEFYAKKGLADWLGVPADIKDGRILGALIEVNLQTLLAPYKVLAFNKEEVVYDIELGKLERRTPMLTHAYLSQWYGYTKTLIGPEWFAWKVTDEEVPEGILRLKIAKKIDKYCL